MTVLYLFAVAAIWLLPILISLCIVFDGEKWLVKDRRFPIAVLSVVLLLWMLWFRRAGPLGPISQLRSLIRRTSSCQDLVNWSIMMLLGLAIGLMVGLLVRDVRYRRGFHFRRGRISVRCRRAVLLSFAVTAIGSALLLSSAAYGARQISLQEVCRRDRGVEEDLSYVTIRNDCAWRNEPKELFLTIDPDEPRQYRAAAISLGPGETVQISENADFFLSLKRSGGDTVYLMDVFGKILDSVELPELPADAVLRRTGDSWNVFAVSGADEKLAVPEFSAPGGFYDAAFDLSLSAENGCQIRYTLDGSVPGADSTLYSAPIHVYNRSGEPNRYRSVQNVQEDYLDKAPIGTTPVDKAIVVRAVAVDAEGRQSPVVTQSYFVDLSEYENSMVISLTADPEDLFGEQGIYVTGAEYDEWYAKKRNAEAEGKPFEEEMPVPNYLMRGSATERSADLEIYADGRLLLNQPVGIRIQGNTSRLRPLKRFSVYSRAVYSGSGLFEAKIFPTKNMHSFVLRDGLDSAISHAIADGRNVAVLKTQPVRVFLNGEFWYDTFLQEKYNNSFFAYTYHVLKENVEFIGIGSWSDATKEEKETYESLLKTAESLDLSNTEDYQALCEIMDVQSYIDYACIQVYLGNADSSERANTAVWRTKLDEHSYYGDGRWRWALYDMDLRRKANRDDTTPTDAAINSFTAKRNENWSPLLSGGILYESLKQSPAFRQQFVRTFMDLVNTTFSESRLDGILASFGEDLNYDDGFFRDRPKYMTGYLAEEFDLTGTVETLSIHMEDPSAGSVSLNTITPDLSSGQWSGQYFTDVPLMLTANPTDGHVFDHWEIDGEVIRSNSAEITLKRGGSVINAIFR